MLAFNQRADANENAFDANPTKGLVKEDSWTNKLNAFREFYVSE